MLKSKEIKFDEKKECITKFHLKVLNFCLMLRRVKTLKVFRNCI